MIGYDGVTERRHLDLSHGEEIGLDRVMARWKLAARRQLARPDGFIRTQSRPPHIEQACNLASSPVEEVNIVKPTMQLHALD